jgi:hypothetical protein
MKEQRLRYFIIGTFVSLYAIVSVISTIHVIDFFRLSNPDWLAISLAIAFEIGAAASLASLIALKKMNKSLVWGLFITLTLMQMMGNTYYAYNNLEDFQSWVELFGLVDSEPIFQKRVLSLVSGAILPLVALGFIKSLVDYIKPEDEKPTEPVQEKTHLQKEADRVWADVARRKEAGEIYEPTAEDLADEPTALANSGYRERAEMEMYDTEEEDETSDEMYNEDQKREMLNDIEEKGELTPDDIEKYKEKSRIKPTKGGDDNPQVVPGVNM